jgi:hypothetical protein
MERRNALIEKQRALLLKQQQALQMAKRPPIKLTVTR